MNTTTATETIDLCVCTRGKSWEEPELLFNFDAQKFATRLGKDIAKAAMRDTEVLERAWGGAQERVLKTIQTETGHKITPDGYVSIEGLDDDVFFELWALLDDEWRREVARVRGCFKSMGNRFPVRILQGFPKIDGEATRYVHLPRSSSIRLP